MGRCIYKVIFLLIWRDDDFPENFHFQSCQLTSIDISTAMLSGNLHGYIFNATLTNFD